MNRQNTFLTLAGQARSFSDMFNALAIRFSNISMQSIRDDENVLQEIMPNDEEVDLIRSHRRSLEFHSISEQIGHLTMNDIADRAHADNVVQETTHDSPALEQTRHASPVASESPVPVISTEAVHSPGGSELSLSVEGEPHEQTPPLHDTVPQAQRIRLDFHTSFSRYLPEEGQAIVNSFVENGVTEENCMQLLQYYAMTFTNLLATIDKYLKPDRTEHIDIRTLNSEARLMLYFNADLIHIKPLSTERFTSYAKVIFPMTTAQTDSEFSALHQPFKAMKKRRTYLHAHMIYMYISANLYRNKQYEEAHLLHGTMIRLVRDNIRILPKVGSDWKWRTAVVNHESHGRLHFVMHA
ncbi:hypothetical protein BD560DRAFT_442134 [Blakeslea trispora]|nr:hypothetical protein BD560DRAFT_442134 [Blakeslea trispora]